MSVNLLGWDLAVHFCLMAERPPVLPYAAPISTERVSDVIAERLAEAIRDGALKPGDQLPTEMQLAREFNVGRTSVREGLGKLRALGLVESRKGLGVFVTQFKAEDPLAEFARWTTGDPASVVGLLEARVSLETLAAGLAAVRADDGEIAELHRLQAAHAAAGESGDVAALVESDAGFHGGIVDAARNPFLSRLYEVLIAELTDFRRKTLALPWAAARSAMGHAAIADAIAGHDPQAARAAMAEHLWVLYEEILQSAASDGNRQQVAPAPREALA